jgi:uncharacterized protein (DUF3820 family)
MTDTGYEDIEIPFGMHKGKLLADIPNSYLAWLLDQEFVEVRHHRLYTMAKLEQQYRIANNIYIED